MAVRLPASTLHGLPLLVGVALLAGCAARSPQPDPPRPPPSYTYEIAGDSVPEPGPASRPEDDAEAQVPAASGFCNQNPPEDEALVHSTRRNVEELMCATTLWVDGLFGDRYNVRNARDTHGHIELSHNWSEYFGHKTRLRLDVNFDLPNLDERYSGFIGRDDTDAVESDRADTSALRARFPQVENRDEWLAGLGYSLPDRRSLRMDFRVGVSNLRLPKLFVQGRLRYNAYSDEHNLVHLRATPFWNNREGFGLTVGADLSHLLSPNRLLRWGTVGTRSEESDGLSWRSALTLYQGLPRKFGVAGELFARGATQLPVPLLEYGLQTTLRHPLLDDSLWAQWVLSYSFPRALRSEEREGAFGIGVGLTLPFGEQP